MQIECTSITLSKEDLEKQLQKKGTLWLNKLFTCGRTVSNIELKYVEYLILEYKISFRKNLGTMLSGNREQENMQSIRMIGNGSTGSVALLEMLPSLEVKDVPASMIQPKDYEPENMKFDSKQVAVIFSRKMLGKRCRTIEFTGVTSVYRPFWAVYFGEARADGKMLGRPYAADGFTIKR